MIQLLLAGLPERGASYLQPIPVRGTILEPGAISRTPPQ
jgi:hypothetical protein